MMMNKNFNLILIVAILFAVIILLFGNDMMGKEKFEDDKMGELTEEEIESNLDNINKMMEQKESSIHVDDVIKRNDTNEGEYAEFNKTDSSVFRSSLDDLEKQELTKQLDKSYAELAHGYDYYMPKKPSEMDENQLKKFANIDLQIADMRLDHETLINTSKYITPVNTIGNSRKNATYGLRPAPANPKITVSPWLQSTYQPDYNTRSL